MASPRRSVARVQRALQRRGVHLGAYKWTYPARRQALWAQTRHLFDVGANTGQFGHEVRSHGYAGRIHSFEPVGAAFAELDAAARADGNWTATRCAVGMAAGMVTVNVSEISTFSSTLPVTAVTLQGFPSAKYVRKEHVTVRPLDELVANAVSAGESYAVKMDVQGFERQVIEGGGEALSAASAVEVELCPVELYEGQAMMLDLMQIMDERGFVPGLIDSIFPQPDGRSLAFNGLFLPA